MPMGRLWGRRSVVAVRGTSKGHMTPQMSEDMNLGLVLGSQSSQ